MRFFLFFILIPSFVFALSVPSAKISQSLDEKKQGRDFLKLIWNTNLVVSDIETSSYLKKLGKELVTHSEDSDKHFDFFFLNNNDINAFAGPYGYVGVYTGLLLKSDSESELAAVLCHEIAHVTQNHLVRFSEKSSKQNYLMLAGILTAALVKDNQASEAILTSTVAATLQQNINFTREHEWEADRIGIKMLKRSGFDPQGMANFFKKLQNDVNAKEFLLTHPLSINRVADSLQRLDRTLGDYKKDSFEYETIKAKLYYQEYGRIEKQQEQAINYYMQAYQAFEKQNYQNAKQNVEKLLLINNDKSSYILAGRIYAKLGDINKAQKYFKKNDITRDEASAYYAAKAYLDNKKAALGVLVLKSFLRENQGSYESYKLLAFLYLKLGKLGRSHIQSAKSLIIQGKLKQAIRHYERAKTLISSQDLYDVVNAKIDALQEIINLHKD